LRGNENMSQKDCIDKNALLERQTEEDLQRVLCKGWAGIMLNRVDP